VSQSPSNVEDVAKDPSTASPYKMAWNALGTMLKQGRSFSGHERNCCYLNLGGGHFADISAASQFDLDCDGRAIAAVDWDHDGDLDYWLSSRTGPAVRYLQNQLANNAHFISVRLEGRTCNRDAIGARLELYVPGQSTPWAIQTLKAGEGYLAQSSKSLHFGLGDHTKIDHIVVRWPGGDREIFRQVSADSRCRLIQGSGVASVLTAGSRKVALAAQQASTTRVNRSARIIAHGPLPLPPLKYKDFDGGEREFDWPDKPVLVNLWATWCQPCITELGELEHRRQQLSAVDLLVLPLCVDQASERASGSSSTPGARDLLKKIAPSFRGGMASTSTIDLLDTIHRTIAATEADLPLPSSFLVNGRGQLVAIYLGPLKISSLIDDAKRLTSSDGYTRDRAIPFPGRWFSAPLPTDLAAIAFHMIDSEKYLAANNYLEYLANTPSGNPSRLADVMRGRLGAVNDQLSKRFIAGKVQHKATAALRRSLAYSPSNHDNRAVLAGLLLEVRRFRESIHHHRKLLDAQPNNLGAANNIAWALAMLADSNPAEIEEAIRLAESTCQKTRYQIPSTIDTLGVAYAAAGRYAEAIASTETAAAMARNQGKTEQADAMLERVSLYRKGKRYQPDESTMRVP